MTEQSSDRARFNMIEQQIRPWDVLDGRVLEVMLQIPREAYVPNAYVGLAYADIEVPIGAGQSMMVPRLQARMLQALNVQPGDKALEIGTGSGYGTACLAALGARVVSIEIDATLAEQARARLEAQKVRADLRQGDALAAPVSGGPFDVIAVTGSLPGEESLKDLQSQLATGGRLFAVVGGAPVMEAVLITRTGSTQFRRESLFETELSALAEVPEPAQFVF